MTWTIVETINLSIDWQYTEPVSGTFFRITHDSAPSDGAFEIGQVEENEDGSHTLFDSQILSPERGLVDIIKLTKPPIFTNRRLAIRRLPTRQNFEQQVRQLFLPAYLQTASSSTVIPKNRWNVMIESSDATEASATVDLTSVTAKLNTIIADIQALPTVDLSGINTKLDAITTKLNNLSTSGSGSTSATTTKTLTYVSDGDANGVFYWIGTNYGASAWANPHTANKVTCSMSSTYDSSVDPASLVDRLPGNKANTANTPNGWFAVDLSSKNQLICNYYSLRGRDWTANHLRSWRFQGSNDALAWADLEVVINDGSINQNSWRSQAINSSVAYRYFRILATAPSSSNDYIFTLGELELYGSLISNN